MLGNPIADIRLPSLKELQYQGGSEADRLAATTAFRQEALLLAGLTHPNLRRVDEHFSLVGR